MFSLAAHKKSLFQPRGKNKADIRIAEQPVNLLFFVITRIVFTKSNAQPGVVCGITSNLDNISHVGITPYRDNTKRPNESRLILRFLQSSSLFISCCIRHPGNLLGPGDGHVTQGQFLVDSTAGRSECKLENKLTTGTGRMGTFYSDRIRTICNITSVILRHPISANANH